MEIVGQVFERLTVVKEIDRIGGMLRVECSCQCGKTKVVYANNLKRGTTRSCGCLMVEQKKAAAKHGGSANGKSTPEYLCWIEMHRRCRDKDNVHYAARGIKVCERWSGSSGFQNFLQDMGIRPEGMSLDRKEVNGNYEPDNCRWATIEVQNNNKRTNRWHEHDGKRMTIGQWTKHFGWPTWVIYQRMAQGMSFEEAVRKGYDKNLPAPEAVA